jgi:Tol biopolymer transport system component
VWFIDKPSDTQPSGLWGVSVAGGEPRFVTDRLGMLSNDGALIAYPEAGRTMVERVETGERWSVPAEGRAIAFSPDGAQIAWQTASSTANFDRRIVDVWVANVDGGNPRSVASLIGGGLSGWLPDGARLLVTGRDSGEAEPFLATLNLNDGTRTLITTGLNIRAVTVSPGGNWIAYTISFSGDAARDGLWVARTDGSGGSRVPWFGAYRWRADDRLVIIPLETGTASQRVVEVQAGVADEGRPLTDPRRLPFRVLAGDWSLSPDGNSLVFVSAADRNIWLLELPPITP